jgi:hypothetical protein
MDHDPHFQQRQRRHYRELKERLDRVQLLAETHAVLGIVYWVAAAMPKPPRVV